MGRKVYAYDVALGMRTVTYDLAETIPRAIFRVQVPTRRQDTEDRPAFEPEGAYRILQPRRWLGHSRSRRRDAHGTCDRVGRKSPRWQDRHRPHPRGQREDVWCDARGRVANVVTL